MTSERRGRAGTFRRLLRALRTPLRRSLLAPLASFPSGPAVPGIERFIRPSALVASLVLVVGCATTGSPFLGSQPTSGEPWQIPADAYPSQRLYRVRYSGPEGEVGFKLTLYLEAAARYRLLASDFGRKLWSLSVDARGEAVWLDYRRKEYCRASAASKFRFVPLAELPLVSLPKLLLGRLPAEPAASLARGEENLSFLDDRGFLWNGNFDGEHLRWWSLVEAGEAVVWWRREDRGGVFTDRREEQEVRWREVVREPLRSPLAEIEIPGKFRRRECGE